MLRKGQWLAAAALAAALTAQPVLAAGGARNNSRPRPAALRIAWETLLSLWGAKVLAGASPQCEPGATEDTTCIDPDTATTSPPQCGPGETEGSCGQDPNG